MQPGQGKSELWLDAREILMITFLIEQRTQPEWAKRKSNEPRGKLKRPMSICSSMGNKKQSLVSSVGMAGE